MISNFKTKFMMMTVVLLICAFFTHIVLAIDLPANSHLDYTGKRWECNRGFFQQGNQCLKVLVPENAEIDYTGHRWTCSRGFYQQGNKCLVVAMPENAEIDYTGHAWTCRRGFYQSGNQCLAVIMPENAEIDYTGHAWTCRRGFYQQGNKCLAVIVPKNAELDYTGHSWKCVFGYKIVNNQCTQMSLEEIQKQHNQQMALLARATGDCSSVIETTIDGDFEGWDGETIFKLSNGQIWQQTEYAYTYEYAYGPEVLIYKTSFCCKMKVEDVDDTICVERLK